MQTLSLRGTDETKCDSVLPWALAYLRRKHISFSLDNILEHTVLSIYNFVI
jgi:hypothetical protein